jgi:UrcA family protein
MTTAISRRISLSRGLLIGLLGSTFSLAAHSGDVIVEADAVAHDDALSMSVSYAGLDLNDPAGMHILYGRLKVAARLVCGGDISGVREVQRIVAHKTCVNDALDSAIDSIGDAALTTLHQKSTAEAPVS